jgi:hypothetical protein
MQSSLFRYHDINPRKRLRDDMDAWGSNRTPRQELELVSWRKQILTQLTTHHAEGSKFCCPASSLEEPSREEHAGEPELMSTMLPSDFPNGVLVNLSHGALLESERELCHASCLKALQTLQSFAIQRAHIQQTQLKHASHVKSNMQANTILHRLADRLQHAQWMYTNSCDCLQWLGMNEQDKRTYKPLREQDVKDLLYSIKGQHDLGEGQVKLSWFWCIEPSRNHLDANSLLPSETGVATEYEDSKYSSLNPAAITYQELRSTCGMVQVLGALQAMGSGGLLAPKGGCISDSFFPCARCQLAHKGTPDS